jgi:hypothetical protein
MSPVTPMVVLSVTAYANNWYNTGNAADVKPLLFGGVATLFLTGFAAIPGMAPVATGIGWLAFTGFILSNAQTPGPIQNLSSLTSKGAKK